MRPLLAFLLIITVFFSCKKQVCNNEHDSTLAGKWRMVFVKDNATNNITAKPPAMNGNVDITFTFSNNEGGTIDGNTPTNILLSNYVTGFNHSISIAAISATKVAETSWGLLFLDNITHSKDFGIDTHGNLNINVATNKTLTFVRP